MQYVGYCHFAPKFTPEIMKLFEDNSEFPDLFKHFHETEEDKCVQIFKNVAKAMSENLPQSGEPTSLTSICEQILNEVSFYPAKPSLLQEELVRLGLKETLSTKLSSIWAEYAKKIVFAKRKVRSDLEKVYFEVVRDVKTQDQHINLYLTSSNNQTVCIKFSPSEMFEFYDKLESIQTSVDSICK